MSFRSDGWLPHYIDNVAVTNGNTASGQWLQLNAAQGFSVQVVCSNGAAGTLYIDGTNYDGVPQVFSTPVSQAISASGSGYFNFSPVDPITTLAQMRCRFVATAGGNVTVAVNIRRMIP